MSRGDHAEGAFDLGPGSERIGVYVFHGQMSAVECQRSGYRLKVPRVPDERPRGKAAGREDPGPRGGNTASGPGSRISFRAGKARAALVRDTSSVM
jgi:hypothetical protein